jgi:hypothetical protein
MTVLRINGQSNAAVVLKGLLQQYGLPVLSPEGIDTLSTRFETGLVIGNGVVTFDGTPLIDALRAIYADADNERFFASSQKSQDQQANTLTERYRAEIAASRKQARITDADLARYTGITRQHMVERQRTAQEK